MTDLNSLVSVAGVLARGWDVNKDGIISELEHEISMALLDNLKEVHRRNPIIEPEKFDEVIESCETRLIYRQILYGNELMKVLQPAKELHNLQYK